MFETQQPLWPYLPTLEHLGLALALGLFVGLERERRGKEAGLRTFGLASLLGALGAMLGTPFALVSLATVAMLAVFLNVQTLRAGDGAELTTAAALIVTTFAGLLVGLGHRLTPAALAVVTAALLAWKERLSGFSRALSEAELRSAILLAILAFVVYPALPTGSVDRWHLIEPRAAWMTVLLIAGMGFANYALLKVYGARGLMLTGFFGGLVNSTVTVTELAARDRESTGELGAVAYRGIVVATGAMLLRNVALLCILAPRTCVAAAPPFVLMFAGTALLLLVDHRATQSSATPPKLPLESPFAVASVLKFGLLFLVLQVGGVLAQRALGRFGFYVVSFLGGLVSSASAVAAAGTLAARGGIDARVAGIGAVLAALASVVVNWPLVARVSADRALSRRMIVPIVALVMLGATGLVVMRLHAWPPRALSLLTDEAAPHREARQRRRAVQVELLHEARAMHVDRLGRDADALADLAIREPLGDEL